MAEGLRQTELRAAALMHEQEQARRQFEEMANAAAANVPALTFKRSPEYTPAALKAGIEGSVELGVVISEGRPIYIWVMHALGYGLDQKAIECVKTWRWQKSASEPLRQTVYVTVPFKLPVQK